MKKALFTSILLASCLARAGGPSAVLESDLRLALDGSGFNRFIIQEGQVYDAYSKDGVTQPTIATRLMTDLDMSKPHCDLWGVEATRIVLDDKGQMVDEVAMKRGGDVILKKGTVIESTYVMGVIPGFNLPARVHIYVSCFTGQVDQAGMRYAVKTDSEIQQATKGFMKNKN